MLKVLETLDHFDITFILSYKLIRNHLHFWMLTLLHPSTGFQILTISLLVTVLLVQLTWVSGSIHQMSQLVHQQSQVFSLILGNNSCLRRKILNWVKYTMLRIAKSVNLPRHKFLSFYCYFPHYSFVRITWMLGSTVPKLLCQKSTIGYFLQQHCSLYGPVRFLGLHWLDTNC